MRALLSKLVQCGVFLRNLAYDMGLVKSQKFPVLVISIGNIVAGGTGKTPLMRLLAWQLEGRSIAILSRGYKGKLEHGKLGVQISAGNGPLYGPELTGDEPFWLAQKLLGVPIWVGKNRRSSADSAIAKGAKILLLEDGMQHRQIARDLEIVVMDVKDPFGGGAFLPLGRLRDSPKRLEKADLIVLNHCGSLEEYEATVQKLRNYTSAKVVGMHLVPNPYPYQKIGLFCGIGSPKRFIETLNGYQVVDQWLLGDHEPADPKKLELFAQKCAKNGAEALFCTEKDAVKLPISLKLSLPIVAVEVHLEPLFGKENWAQFIREIHERRD